MQLFWEFFWRIYGIFLMIVGMLLFWKAVRAYWLATRNVVTEQQELHLLSRYWFGYALFFLFTGFFVYISAPTTANLFSTLFMSFIISVILVYLIFKWLHRWLQGRAGNRKA